MGDTSSERREQAAEVLAAGGSKAAAARAAGVHRSTIDKWLDKPDFQLLVREQQADYQSITAEANKGLAELVPQAIQLLDQAINGNTPVPSARARLALDIVKAAASLQRGGSADAGTLANRLMELEGRGSSAGGSD